VVVRFLIWNVVESHTSLDELRDSLPDLEPPSAWLWNEATERFGILAFGDELPEAAGWAQNLIGEDPDVYEEFDAA
jgi:hypothetical protein